MATKKLSVFAICAVLAFPLFSQALQIDTVHRCLYTGVFFGTQPRQGSNDAEVEKMVDTICQLAGVDRASFQVMNARVSSVAAVTDAKGKYLLYNRGELKSLMAMRRPWAYFLLAHEIGHLHLAHSLDARKRIREEAEADRFAASVVKKIGDFTSLDVLLEQVEAFPYSYLAAYPFKERKTGISTGWNTAEALNKGLSFGNNPSDVENSPLPRFKKSGCPKECTLNTRRFEGCAVLGDINFRICRALDKQGYTDRRYFAVKNGFAIVTAAEQFRAAPALSSIAGNNRWLDYPPRPSFDGVWDYFSKMFFPDPTYFRVFVFVVTNQSALEYEPGCVSVDGCKEWLQRGGNVLPDYLAKQSVNGHSVRGLVYEFRAEESNKQAHEECRLSARAEDHLQKAGILDQIKK
ncbi:MAG: hypothetical protein LCH81_02170 [Bacteroidetes bacterium]|nr:hypothetical protein [Bacteroidota bacterium]